MKLIVVSNRLPVTISRTEEGFEYNHSSGGLVTGLKSINTKINFQWYGNLSSKGLNTNDKEIIRNDCSTKFNLCPIFIDDDLNHLSYNGFCNGILWPMLHYFSDDVMVSDEYYKAYIEYNEIFCSEILKTVEEGDIIWVHDYHLMVLPEMIRKNLKDKKLDDKVKIMFFLHTPWPSSLSFNRLYCKNVILNGLMAADLISFHSPEYLINFIECCKNGFKGGCKSLCDDKKAWKGACKCESSCGNGEKCGCKGIDNACKGACKGDCGCISKNNSECNNDIRHTKSNKYINKSLNKNQMPKKLEAIPIGIDPNIFVDCIKTEETQSKIKYYKDKFKNKKIILGVDRSDYIKGIPHRIEAYKNFLKDNPKYIENTVLMQVSVPSRTDVTEYKGYTECVNKLVSETNSTLNSEDINNIYLVNKSVDFSTLCALYCVSDILLITSLRDGMNLVAMEYVSANYDTRGVLILSEFTGVVSTLPGSLIVNTWNTQNISESIKQAMEMNEEERIKRYEINRENVYKFTSFKWAEDNLNALGIDWENEIRK